MSPTRLLTPLYLVEHVLGKKSKKINYILKYTNPHEG